MADHERLAFAKLNAWLQRRIERARSCSVLNNLGKDASKSTGNKPGKPTLGKIGAHCVGALECCLSGLQSLYNLVEIIHIGIHRMLNVTQQRLIRSSQSVIFLREMLPKLIGRNVIECITALLGILSLLLFPRRSLGCATRIKSRAPPQVDEFR